jgi:hypothetical protein
MTSNIVLASDSPFKIEAVNAFFSKSGVEIVGCKTVTDLPQPLGRGDAKYCLMLRFEQAARLANEQTLYIIGLENLVMRIGAQEFGDVCLIGIRRRSADGTWMPPVFGQIDYDRVVQVPKQLNETLYEVLRDHKDLRSTCGQMLKYLLPKVGGDYDDRDWFRAAGCEFGRVEQLLQALERNREMLMSDFQTAPKTVE